MPKTLYVIAIAILVLAFRPAFADPPAKTAEQTMTTNSKAKPTPEQEKAMLAPYRARIDALDTQIVGLLGERFGIIKEVAKLKAEHGIAPILPYRVEEVVRNARARAEKAGVDPDLVEKIYRIIIDTACQQEEDFARAQQAKHE
ncbi:MAG TPA: chorismate mutase [Alphaproteobacteria bacterium]|jgi:isochorismate pyruvate lyase|nr:chorismate mutase [Alphaproteobacteria bacterium]